MLSEGVPHGSKEPILKFIDLVQFSHVTDEKTKAKATMKFGLFPYLEFRFPDY